MDGLDFDWICRHVESGSYSWSLHADQERQADNLTVAQVETAIRRGRIIESYPDQGRGASCLIVGFCDQGIPIHAVCGVRGGMPVIITTYIPGPPKFKNPYRRG